MQISEAIELIRHPEVVQPGSRIWADLGSGSGLFTYALANLLPEGSVMYAIDKNQVMLNKHPKPEHTVIHQLQADFVRQALQLPGLDGILMANSLHYVEDKTALLLKLSKYLKEDGVFLLVEYDTDIANRWVPYPVSFDRLKGVFEKAGYTKILKLQEKPSLYQRANLYAAYISR